VRFKAQKIQQVIILSTEFILRTFLLDLRASKFLLPVENL
jgi:hypothetical protein